MVDADGRSGYKTEKKTCYGNSGILFIDIARIVVNNGVS